MLLAHVAARDDLERGEKLVAEVLLPAADAGERGGGADHRAVADLRAVVRFDAPDRRDDMAVDAVGSLHGIERRAVLGQDHAAVGNARVGDQDVEIFPGRLGELGLRVEQIHDPQVGRDPRQQLVEQRPRHVAALRQWPDGFEAVAEICRRRPDGGRAHQRMTGGAVFAGPFARRLDRIWARRLLRRCLGCGVRRREQRADVEALRGRTLRARDESRSRKSKQYPRPCHIHHQASLPPRIATIAPVAMLYGRPAIKAQSRRSFLSE